jgi:hypothetical protein
MALEKATFTAPLPIGRMADPNPIITLTASIAGNQITITDTDLINKQQRSRTYNITAEDDETFMVPNDLSSATKNMLVGIGQRMMYLKRYGYDREP